jgi:hypothetical protein
MKPELAAIVDWLCASGRMEDIHYGRLLREVTHISERALFMVNSQDDVQTLATLAIASRTVETHLEAAAVDHDPAALALLLAGLIPLARFVGDNPIRLFVAIGVLKSEEILALVDEKPSRTPPPPA